MATMPTIVANQVETCFGCGAVVPTSELPGHRYVGSSPGCWAVYGTVLAREYGEWRFPAIHRLTVDAYMVQHPGMSSRQSIQSVAVHLVGLFAVLELGLSSAKATHAIRRAVEQSDRFIWLEPPTQRGELTVLDIANAVTLAEHEQIVRQWAQSVWQSWKFHHSIIRQWAKAV